MPLTTDIPSDFHDQFAAWVRIEPRCRSNDFARGVQARISDPLWMLARQWQVGEFQGEDAGTPAQVEFSYETQPVTTIKMGNSLTQLPDKPIEMYIEQERPKLTWRLRIQIGQTCERLIRQQLPAYAEALINYYRQHFLFTPPPETDPPLDQATSRFVKFMEGRAIDGQPILAAHSLPLGQNLGSRIIDADLDRLKAIHRELKERYVQYCPNPRAKLSSEAWLSPRLNYQFELNYPIRLLPFAGSSDSWLSPVLRPNSLLSRPPFLDREEMISTLFPSIQTRTAPTRLIAKDYQNGELDWYTFAVQGQLQGVWRESPPVQAYPMALRIRETSPRWWAFEDANTDFGDLDVAKPDLAKLMLMEFVLISGYDWFTVPLPVTMNRLVRINKLKVTNVFNEPPLVIKSARQVTGGPLQRWEVFTLSNAADPGAAGVGHALYIPPVVGVREESPPLEEVRFLRDEGANMVWAVEHTVLNGLGCPVDGFEAQLERLAQQREAELACLQKQLAEVHHQLHRGQLRRFVMTYEERVRLEEQATDLRRRIEVLEQGAPPPSAGDGLHYRLASWVPENWIPFMPQDASSVIQSLTPPLSGLTDAGVESSQYPVIRLRRAQMLRNTATEGPEPIQAMSRLLDLEGEPLLWLEETTVPRSGLRLQLTHQRVRWVDGKTYVWMGRKVLMGRGEGSIGLQFDIAAIKRE